MAVKRKRTSSPVFSKTQTHFGAEPNMYSISPSSSTSWSSISSTTSSSLSGPHTPHDGSPLSNLKHNVRLRKSIFDAHVTDDVTPTDAEAATIDTWRMEVDSNEHNLSNIKLNVSPLSVAYQNGTNLDSAMDDEPEANISGRTRKRFRDNRPAASVIHENTLKKLFNAQRVAKDGPSTLPTYSQQLNPQQSHFQSYNQSEQRFDIQPSPSVSLPSTSFSLPQSTTNTSTRPSSSSSLSNLDSFLGLSTTTTTTTTNKYYINNGNHITNLSHSQRPILQRLLAYTPNPPPPPSSSSSLITPFNSQNKHSMASCPTPTPQVAKPACEDCDSPLLLQTYSTPITTKPTTSRGSTTIAGNPKDGIMVMMMDVDMDSTGLHNNSNSMIDDDNDNDLLRHDFACRTCGRLVCDYCACVMDHRRCLACSTSGGGCG